MDDLYVGRQSMYNRARELASFELLYRTGRDDSGELEDGKVGSARVILDALTGMGLERVVGHHTAFIAVDRSFLIDEGTTAPVNPQIVYEFCPDIATDEPLLRALWHLAGDGRRFALGEFDDSEAARQFLAVADYVKLDVEALPQERLRELVPRLREYDVKLIAAGIESTEALDRGQDLGFDLFQGNHFAQPRVL